MERMEGDLEPGSRTVEVTRGSIGTATTSQDRPELSHSVTCRPTGPKDRGRRTAPHSGPPGARRVPNSKRGAGGSIPPRPPSPAQRKAAPASGDQPARRVPPSEPSSLRTKLRGDPWLTRHHPIQTYGVIGNNRTAILVSPEGSIDWAPFPQFDSPPIFFGLLDAGRGGLFALRPSDPIQEDRWSYQAGTNVLTRRVRTRDGGEARFVDFCPETEADLLLISEVHRRVCVTRGTVGIEVRYAPRFDYGRQPTELRRTPHGLLASGTSEIVTLSTDRRLGIDLRHRGAFGRFSLRAGEEEWFVLSQGADRVHPVRAFDPDRRLHQTLGYWRSWSKASTYAGRWRGPVERSALTLRLLTFRPTGAMVAAPTTSLPERLGGPRNWDYRFTWIRDTALALRAFFRLGYSREAVRFIYWLLSILDRDRSRLKIFYSVDGRPPPPERILRGLAGYRRSRPVRVGNAAHDQSQHDAAANIVSIVELLEQNGEIVSADLWKQVRRILQRAAQEWSSPDNGIWEIRGRPRHYVYSKAAAWSALVRGADLGERLRFDGPFDEWRRQARAIREDVLEHGRIADGSGSLAWYYGSAGPDASLFRLAELGFLAPDDPIMKVTARRIEADLAQGPFVYRYHGDGGPLRKEGFFLACSFWRIEYLTRAGDLGRARKLLEGILEHAGTLGLFAEEIGPTGDHLGNYPQALTHLALVSAVTELDTALTSGRGSVRSQVVRGALSRKGQGPLPEVKGETIASGSRAVRAGDRARRR
ncbi:MAG: glycoside hydrolase family 15 protein [Thermoplasmata archaeon]